MAGGGQGVLSLCLWGVINIMNMTVVSGRGGGWGAQGVIIMSMGSH